MLLSDADLKQLLDDHPGTVDPSPSIEPDVGGLMQAASIDLTIGMIYVPETDADKPGGVCNPRTDAYDLEAGGTVIVRTAQRINLPSTIAAIGFPPARVSRNGILMTNPGHIDPGYEGFLTFTLINMGRKDRELKVGSPIATLLFFALNTEPAADWKARGNVPTDSPVKQITLDKLTRDFLNVENRARAIAEDAEKRVRRTAQIWTSIAGAIVLLVPVITLIWNTWIVRDLDLEALDDRVASIEQQIGELKLDDRISDVEETVNEIAESLKAPSEE